MKSLKLSIKPKCNNCIIKGFESLLNFLKKSRTEKQENLKENEKKFLELLNSSSNKENLLNILELENTNKAMTDRFKIRKFLLERFH